MLVNTALTYALAFAAALPVVVADYPWNDQWQFYNIGEVPAKGPKAKLPADWMGRCGGNDIKVGGYGCGNFGAVGNVIYKCVQNPKKYEGAWLKQLQTCRWSNGADGGQCAKNQRVKGKKFYPLVDSKKVACVTGNEV